MSIQTANNRKLIAQEQISASDFLNLTTSLLSVIVLLYDLTRSNLQFNYSQICIQLDYNEHEALPDFFDIAEVIHEDDYQQFTLILEEFEKGNYSTQSFSCRFRKKDGSYVSYLLRFHVCEAAAKIAMIATKEILSPETEQVAELKRIKAETESILQFGTFEYDLHTGVGKWSDGLYELLGYKDERPEIDRLTFLQYIDLEEKNTLQNIDDEAREYSRECRILTKEGIMKIVQIVGRRMFDGDNHAVKDAGIIRDITHKRKQEENLKQAIDELQRSNKELEEFAYVASHDLQEPLRKISTFTDRLTDKFSETLNEEGRLYLDRIMASADSMRVLIDNLLEFSRISRIKQPFAPLNLNFVLQQVKNELELNIEETGTRIVTDQLPVIEGSLSQMKQLFNNIINNAIKFRKPDIQPEILITCHQLLPAEKKQYNLLNGLEYYMLKFCDNGIGFEKEYATRIFQIFQRLHGKSEYPGSGIGLAICKKIVDHHKGIIYADNVENMGACFTIILPQRQDS